MRWRQVASPRAQPANGIYSDWKTQIANDCFQQCVYCAIHESAYGGIDNFHVEHLRPKSVFEELEHIIDNLFLACAICNRFKSNDWPADPVDDHSSPGYPSPAEFDYNGLFEIDLESYSVTGRYVASSYLTERLYLNRPQLLIERRSFFLRERIREVEQAAREVVDRLAISHIPETAELLRDLLVGLIDLRQSLDVANAARPYEREDVRRPQA